MEISVTAAGTMVTAREESEWETNPKNPRQWSRRRKWAATLTACYMSCLVSIAASAYSQAVEQISSDLHTSTLLAVSGISLYVPNQFMHVARPD